MCKVEISKADTASGSERTPAYSLRICCEHIVQALRAQCMLRNPVPYIAQVIESHGDETRVCMVCMLLFIWADTPPSSPPARVFLNLHDNTLPTSAKPYKAYNHTFCWVRT